MTHQNRAIMRKVKHAFNLDALKVSFLQENGMFEQLVDNYRCGDFDTVSNEVHIVCSEDGRGETGEYAPVSMNFELCGDNIHIGTFTFNQNAKFNERAFFKFENKALWTPTVETRGHSYTPFQLMSIASDGMDLPLSTITYADIAGDTTENALKIVQHLVHNHHEWDMFVNGNLVRDTKRAIDGYAEVSNKARERRVKFPPTIYFEQSKDETPFVRIYNKSREVEMNDFEKQHILDALNFGKRDVYRIELHVPNPYLRKFDAHKTTKDLSTGGDINWIFSTLTSNADYRQAVFKFFTNRLVKWRRKSDGLEIGLCDIVDGTAGQILREMRAAKRR